MITSDFHIHTSFSSDSETPMKKMIETGIQLGLKTMCITDHMDLDFPKKYEHSFLFDVKAQQKKIDDMRSQFGDQILILKGIELGLQPHLKEELTKLTSEYHFDFIIGSTHVVDQIDPYYSEYWFRPECPFIRDGIERYYQSTLNSIKAFSDFDTYGHLDYIIRYLPKDKPFIYQHQDFADLLDEILKKLIDLGKGIEVNTGGYKAGLSRPNPDVTVIKRYLELGGEIITIGSDAHTPSFLGYEFARVEELLSSIGIRYYTIFKKRKPEFVKLG